MSRLHYDDLLRQAEEQHARYLRTLRELFDSTSGSATEERNMAAYTPPLRPLQVNAPLSVASTFAGDLTPLAGGSSRRPRRLTNETGERRPFGLKHTPASLQNYDMDSSDEDEFHPLPPSQVTTGLPPDDLICVQQPLRQTIFDERDLLVHLQSAERSEGVKIALDDVYERREELTMPTMFQVFNDRHDKLYDSATYEVYEVGKDGAAERKHDVEDNDTDLILDARTVWDTVKHVNFTGTAMGRMTSLFDPSPLMLGTLHMTMGGHFDMDEIFQHLVTMEGNKGKTRAYMNRAFEQNELRQRSFFFVFKYYTVVGEKCTPAPWQKYDHRPADTRAADHIDICECSSVLALSLSGEPVRTLERRRRRRAKAEVGNIYSTFAPWQLLNIQCVADDEHVMRNEDSRKVFYNGPYAFLDSLAMEYRDAVKRNIALNDLISKLITPPVTFMFDVRLRDKLLFEDKHFTYSRRYFWAYNTLAVINDGIKSMINAYTETFTKDFWAGRHPTLFPHPDAAQGSPEFQLYVAKLRPLRQELEAAVAMLHQVYEMNEGTRQEIRSLRDQLFSGSSVKESRRAIEQGDNIKILTSLSIIFLPLTFVTSVWSMTGFPLDVDDWQFPATMVCAGVPFLFFVCVVQTRTGMEALTRTIERADEWFKDLAARWARRKEQIAAPAPAGAKLREPRLGRRRRRFSRREDAESKAGDELAADYVARRGWWQWWRRAARVGDRAV
ncbi:hypothetical protein JX265_003875 [Neoarthrinium moseri]|uniref:Uncharacterized protein n=1 Tax=Neoarthrinium moseri TaxID=1658444 RepID=A0A9P9WRC4_9PEZI|nr:hypothetical protein JX266_001775 [Neoarthrinium moseri]KAI1876349.1 hypothetical protein JX265_003875 [Neoarthrinium moseri]